MVNNFHLLIATRLCSHLLKGCRGEDDAQRRGSRRLLDSHAGSRNANPSDALAGLDLPLGEIDMIKVLPPPTEAEEYRNAAEILRDLAAQTRFGKTRNELLNCADNLERLAALADHRLEGMVQTLPGE